MRIIFNDSGRAGVLIPMQNYMDTLTGTDEEKLIHIADKDLPAGTKYEIVADADVPNDRTDREFWEYVSGPNERTAGA